MKCQQYESIVFIFVLLIAVMILLTYLYLNLLLLNAYICTICSPFCFLPFLLCFWISIIFLISLDFLKIISEITIQSLIYLSPILYWAFILIQESARFLDYLNFVNPPSQHIALFYILYSSRITHTLSFHFFIFFPAVLN